MQLDGRAPAQHSKALGIIPSTERKSTLGLSLGRLAITLNVNEPSALIKSQSQNWLKLYALLIKSLKLYVKMKLYSGNINANKIIIKLIGLTVLWGKNFQTKNNMMIKRNT